jgi:hypothetical protein
MTLKYYFIDYSVYVRNRFTGATKKDTWKALIKFIAETEKRKVTKKELKELGYRVEVVILVIL